MVVFQKASRNAAATLLFLLFVCHTLSFWNAALCGSCDILSSCRVKRNLYGEPAHGI